MWNMWFTYECENCSVLEMSKKTQTAASHHHLTYRWWTFYVCAKIKTDKFPEKSPSALYQTQERWRCMVSQWLRLSSVLIWVSLSVVYSPCLPSGAFQKRWVLCSGTRNHVFEEGYNITVASACSVKEGGSGRGACTLSKTPLWINNDSFILCQSNGVQLNT